MRVEFRNSWMLSKPLWLGKYFLIVGLGCVVELLCALAQFCVQSECHVLSKDDNSINEYENDQNQAVAGRPRISFAPSICRDIAALSSTTEWPQNQTWDVWSDVWGIFVVASISYVADFNPGMHMSSWTPFSTEERLCTQSHYDESSNIFYYLIDEMWQEHATVHTHGFLDHPSACCV